MDTWINGVVCADLSVLQKTLEVSEMMDVRSFDVIDSLYREKGYLDGDELASSLDISTRTLRDIIKDVREHVEQYGATISYKNNFGYRLEVHQKTLFESFLAQEKKEY